MKYEWLALIVILALVAIFSVTKRWVRWPFRLRTLFWCGGFSYLVLLALPRIFVLQSWETVVQVIFFACLAILFSWILAYHKS